MSWPRMDCGRESGRGAGGSVGTGPPVRWGEDAGRDPWQDARRQEGLPMSVIDALLVAYVPVLVAGLWLWSR